MLSPDSYLRFRLLLRRRNEVRKGAICVGVETLGSGLRNMFGKGGETNIVVMNEAILLFAKLAPCMSR